MCDQCEIFLIKKGDLFELEASACNMIQFFTDLTRSYLSFTRFLRISFCKTVITLLYGDY